MSENFRQMATRTEEVSSYPSIYLVSITIMIGADVRARDVVNLDDELSSTCVLTSNLGNE